MIKTDKINPITGEHFMKAECHDVNWNKKSFDELTDEEKVTFMSYKDIKFLGDMNRDHVRNLYLVERLKNNQNYSQMDDNELLKVGFKLMKASIRNLFNKDAEEHKEYERYMIELENRQINKIDKQK